MTSNTASDSFVSWLKDLLNGLLVWLVALVLYTIPGFIIALPMGFSLGPKLRDGAETGRLISQAVSHMYQTSLYVHYGYILALGLLILWRTRVISKRSSNNSIMHGILIAVIPLLFTALPFGLTGHVRMCTTAVLLFLAAGIIGSLKNAPRTTSQ
jgi:hypothetical protein